MMLSTVALLAACETAGVGKPDAPDASSVLSSFEMPTGSLADGSSAEQARALREPLAGLLLLCGVSALEDASCAGAAGCQRCRMSDAVSRSLHKLATALQRDGDVADAGEELPEIPGASGLVHVTTVCDGWQDPTPDPANGHYELDVGFTGRGLDGEGTGRFAQCKLDLDGTLVRLTGKVLYTFAPATNVPFDDITTQPIVIAFDGTVFIAADNREQPLQVAVRSDPASATALTLDVPGNGSFVVRLLGQDVEVRSRDQRLRCQLQEGACAVVSPP